MKHTFLLLFSLLVLASCQKDVQSPLVGDYVEADGARVVVNIAEHGGCLKMTVFDRDTACDFATFLDQILLFSKAGDDANYMGQAVLGTPDKHSGGRADEIVFIVAEFSQGTLFLKWESKAGGCSKTMHLKKID